MTDLATTLSHRLNGAWKAAAMHFGFSLLVAGSLAALVLLVWYPFPYTELVGGLRLFALVTTVDIVCGPLLTLILFHTGKKIAELTMDLSLVVLLQLGALAYGLNVVAMSRPVAVVFEVDRLRVVTSVEVEQEDLAKAKPPLNKLSWIGPALLSARDPANGSETIASIELSLKGNEPSQRPHWWQPYETARSRVLEVARPVAMLRTKHPTKTAMIDQMVKESGASEANLRWLPITSFKSSEWVALVDATSARPISYLPLDGF